MKGDLEDYIHAVVVNVRVPMFTSYHQPYLLTHTHSCQGYKQQRAFIIAQSPMQSTARDFWKVVYDRKCGVIVTLCDLTEGGKVRMGLIETLTFLELASRSIHHSHTCCRFTKHWFHT